MQHRLELRQDQSAAVIRALRYLEALAVVRLGPVVEGVVPVWPMQAAEGTPPIRVRTSDGAWQDDYTGAAGPGWWSFCRAVGIIEHDAIAPATLADVQPPTSVRI